MVAREKSLLPEGETPLPPHISFAEVREHILGQGMNLRPIKYWHDAELIARNFPEFSLMGRTAEALYSPEERLSIETYSYINKPKYKRRELSELRSYSTVYLSADGIEKMLAYDRKELTRLVPGRRFYEISEQIMEKIQQNHPKDPAE